MKIYTISTIRSFDEHGNISNRVVGFYRSRALAEKVIETNSGDIYEQGYYPYAMIEEVEEGLYPYCPNALWYKWEGDKESGKYVPMDKPAILKHIVNFTMG